MKNVIHFYHHSVHRAHREKYIKNGPTRP